MLVKLLLDEDDDDRQHLVRALPHGKNIWCEISSICLMVLVYYSRSKQHPIRDKDLYVAEQAAAAADSFLLKFDRFPICDFRHFHLHVKTTSAASAAAANPQGGLG